MNLTGKCNEQPEFVADGNNSKRDVQGEEINFKEEAFTFQESVRLGSNPFAKLF